MLQKCHDQCKCIQNDEITATNSLYKVNDITDNISKPGLYDPSIDFNQKNSILINHPNGLNGSHISFINDDETATSQITQFSCYTNASYISTSSRKTAKDTAATTTTTTTTTMTTTTTTTNIVTPSTSTSFMNASWCFDTNFYLKLKVTAKSGILFGLNAFFFITASLFVPINLRVMIQSATLMVITIYVKISGDEKSNLLFFISLFIILMILPFAIKYELKTDTLYLDNKAVANGTLYIIISIICDIIGSGLLIMNIISISWLIKLIKPSRMRFENDREPSIIEIAFLFHFGRCWCCCYLVYFVFFFHSQHILTSNISSTDNYNHTVIDLVANYVVFKYLIISIFNQLFYTFHLLHVYLL